MHIEIVQSVPCYGNKPAASQQHKTNSPSDPVGSYEIYTQKRRDLAPNLEG